MHFVAQLYHKIVPDMSSLRLQIDTAIPLTSLPGILENAE